MNERNQNKKTFGDLPQALVEEILQKSKGVGDSLYTAFKDIQNKKEQFRKQLKEVDFLRQETEFSLPPIPTTCGIDGAYAKEELLSTDFLVAAAVALEGLIPPSETRYWEAPHHKVFVKEERHNTESSTILRGIMIGMEQILSEKAPHDIVFIDGSLTTPLIHLNQAINGAKSNKDLEVSKFLIDFFPEVLKAYARIVGNTRSDKLWVGIPKYTANREIGEELKWEKHYDDKAILTAILHPNELIGPIGIKKPEKPWHLNYDKCKEEVNIIISALQGLKILYYKPNEWTPALRIELNASAANNNYQIGMLIQALKHQCSTPGILEPYPLFIADRMVKSLGPTLPTFRQVITHHMAENYEGDIGEIFFHMQGYRTEHS